MPEPEPELVVDRTGPEYYTPQELSSPDALYLLRWYLHRKVPQGYRGRVKYMTGMSSEDLVQEVVLRLLQTPPLRKYALSTVCVKRLRWVLYRLATRRRRQFLPTFEPLQPELVSYSQALPDVDFHRWFLLRHARVFGRDHLDKWGHNKKTLRNCQILCDRLGLNEESEEYSFRQAARKYHLTTERIRQVVEYQLYRIRGYFRNSDRFVRPFPLSRVPSGQKES